MHFLNQRWISKGKPFILHINTFTPLHYLGYRNNLLEAAAEGKFGYTFINSSCFLLGSEQQK